MQNIRTHHRIQLLASALIGVCLLAVQSPLYAVTFTATNGSNLSASADFTISGGNLDIHLVNTSSTPVSDNPDVLTGLFFDVSGAPTLTADSINLDGSSSYVNTSVNSPSGVLGDHWAYTSGSITGPSSGGTYEYGIGAAGFGVFNSSDTFTGSGGSPDGVDYGLVGVLSGSPTNGLKHNGPQVENGVNIVLDGSLTGNETISNVWFQYGSAFSGEPGFPGTPPSTPPVPEPGTGAMALALGSVTLIFGMSRVTKHLASSHRIGN